MKYIAKIWWISTRLVRVPINYNHTHIDLFLQIGECVFGTRGLRVLKLFGV